MHRSVMLSEHIGGNKHACSVVPGEKQARAFFMMLTPGTVHSQFTFFLSPLQSTP